jgi:hydroxymethylpyrimidine/phosphomethylpyrimidine kinase
MSRRRTVLTIAGSDSSGGAGIQADLKAIAACGGYGASVITAITAQNTQGVIAAEPVSVPLVQAQMRAVFDDLDVAAVKTGMLATRAIVEAVAAELRARAPQHLVVDPVMISKTGFALLPSDCVDALRTAILPLATLVTPNVHEAAALTGLTIETVDDAIEAGRRLVAAGAKAALVKGGHLASSPGTDLLVTAHDARAFRDEWIDTKHTHGTGCTYSAALATHLGAGIPLEEAVTKSKRFVTEAIRAGVAVGRGVSPTDPFFDLHPTGQGP